MKKEIEKHIVSPESLCPATGGLPHQHLRTVKSSPCCHLGSRNLGREHLILHWMGWLLSFGGMQAEAGVSMKEVRRRAPCVKDVPLGLRKGPVENVAPSQRAHRRQDGALETEPYLKHNAPVRMWANAQHSLPFHLLR